MGLTGYLRQVDGAVDATPPERNRVVDSWRVFALLAVVYGHWLAASVWVEPDGTVTVLNTLEWIPYAEWATWIIQVMPVFFFVGGYANAKALDRRSTNRRSWLFLRFRRLFTPAVPVVLVWVVLVLILREFVSDDLIYAGTLNATLPLWFLAVYLALIAIAPFTYALWKRMGPMSVALFLGLALAVDVVNLGLEVPGVRWANYAFVWAVVHQLGYWWAQREATGSAIRPLSGVALSAMSLGTLVLVTSIGWYPVAMITIPGGGPNNVTPPTAAVILLSLVQIGIILATASRIRAWASRRRNWKPIVAISGFMMTIYVWHLTALSLIIAVGVFTFDGVLLSLEPGTTWWWLTRPVWYLVLTGATLLLVMAFGMFERSIRISETDRPMPYVAVALVLCVVALSGTAFVYLVNKDSTINWWIPATTVIAASMVGAVPVVRRAPS